jgi:hypothetical protein
MRRRPRDLTGLRWAPAVLTVALLTAPVAALAYWTAHGSGTATGSVGTLAAPSISNAKPGAGTVELNWTTVTPPGPGEVTYYVSRDGGAASGACPSSSSPSSETSCTDTGVSLGTHHYTVTAVWRSWTATSTSTSVEVTFGPATHLLLTPASTTPTAGTGDALTITAQDASNNTVATYTGEKSLAFGGASVIGPHGPTVSSATGSAIAMGTHEPISFSGGVATVSGTSNGVMTLYKAETASITVTDGSIGNGSGVSVMVKPATANSFSVPTPPAQTAGKAFEETLTAKDEYGNLATGYAGSKAIAFSGPSNSPSGEKPKYPSTVSFSEGAGKATITLYKAEATTLTAKEGPISGTSGSFTVNAGTAEKLAWTSPKSSNGSAEGLCLFTCTWNGIGKGNSWTTQVGVADAGGNVVSELGGSHKVTFSATEGTAPKEVTVPATGPAVTTAVEYKSPTPTGWTTATLTAKSLGFSDATVTFNK